LLVVSPAYGHLVHLTAERPGSIPGTRSQARYSSVPEYHPCYRDLWRNNGTFWTRQGRTLGHRGFVCGAATATETATKDGPCRRKLSSSPASHPRTRSTSPNRA